MISRQPLQDKSAERLQWLSVTAVAVTMVCLNVLLRCLLMDLAREAMFAAVFVVLVGAICQILVFRELFYLGPLSRRARSSDQEIVRIFGVDLKESPRIRAFFLRAGPKFGRRVALFLLFIAVVGLIDHELGVSLLNLSGVLACLMSMSFFIAITPRMLWIPLLVSILGLTAASFSLVDSSPLSRLIIVLLELVEVLVFARFQAMQAEKAYFADQPGVRSGRFKNSFLSVVVPSVFVATLTFCLVHKKTEGEKSPVRVHQKAMSQTLRKWVSPPEAIDRRVSQETGLTGVTGARGGPQNGNVSALPGEYGRGGKATESDELLGDSGAGAGAGTAPVEGLVKAIKRNSQAIGEPREVSALNSTDSLGSEDGRFQDQSIEVQAAAPLGSGGQEGVGGGAGVPSKIAPKPDHEPGPKARSSQASESKATQSEVSRGEMKPMPEPKKEMKPLPKWKPSRLIIGAVLLLAAGLLIYHFLLGARSKQKSREQRSKNEHLSSDLNHISTMKAFREKCGELLANGAQTDQDRRKLVVALYNLLLGFYAQCGAPKPNDFTPDEYAAHHLRLAPTKSKEMGYVTTVFCGVHYGNQAPSSESFNEYVNAVNMLSLHHLRWEDQKVAG